MHGPHYLFLALDGADLDNRTLVFDLPFFGKVSINVAAVVTRILVLLIFPNELLFAGYLVTAHLGSKECLTPYTGETFLRARGITRTGQQTWSQ